MAVTPESRQWGRILNSMGLAVGLVAFAHSLGAVLEYSLEWGRVRRLHRWLELAGVSTRSDATRKLMSDLRSVIWILLLKYSGPNLRVGYLTTI